jgi:hypothetical protein
LEEVAAGIFAPAQAYFERTFFDEGSALAHQVAMSRAAQYFNPVYATQKPVTNEEIDALAIYVRPTPSIIRQMKAECKRYLELACDLLWETDLVEWCGRPTNRREYQAQQLDSRALS